MFKNQLYQANDIANMDQTPLPFILDDKKAYARTNVKDVIAKTGNSGWNKRQATAQITVAMVYRKLNPSNCEIGERSRIKKGLKFKRS